MLNHFNHFKNYILSLLAVVALVTLSGCNGGSTNGVTIQPVTLSKSTSVMNPLDLHDLGITSYTAAGFTFNGTEPSINYSWVVINASAFGPSFNSEQEAIADVTFRDSHVLNPSFVLASPTKWINGSSITLKLTLTTTSNKGTNVFGTANYIVTFQGWSSQTVVNLSKISGDMNSFDSYNLGVSGFTTNLVNLDLTPENPLVSYSWAVDKVEGVLNFSDSAARNDIWFQSNNVLSGTCQ